MTVTRTDVTVLNTDAAGSGPNATWWHISILGAYFIVSAADVELGPFTSETMAFEADQSGRVTSWHDRAVVQGKDHEACISALLEDLNGRND